jgi:hypothetical protein
MMTEHRRIIRWTLMASTAACLAACGGGGFSTSPMPTPPPTPTPTPTPTPVNPPLPPGPIGLTTTSGFAVEAATVETVYPPAGAPTQPPVVSTGDDLVSISYSEADQSYTVALPDYTPGKLTDSKGNGSYDGTGWTHLYGTFNRVSNNPQTDDNHVGVSLDWPASSQFTYTNFGSWTGDEMSGADTIRRAGVFAYGIPTAPGDVPLVGSASYVGQIRGTPVYFGGYERVYGQVGMDFDFASGTMGGQLDLVYGDYYADFAIPTMPFHETVFAKGSTTFSGNFDTAGVSSDTHFSGRFTGPNAAELMANFGGTLLIPQTKQTVDIVGVWIAAKH